MPVLIEAISVIVRRDAIRDRFPGGWAAFKLIVPNQTLCLDVDIARVGFMSASDSKAFVETLERQGLRFLVEGKAQDIVVVDQIAGPTTECGWLEMGETPLPETGTIRIARLCGSTASGVDAPEGWKFAGSLSDKFMFVPMREVNESLTFLRNEDGTDIYLDRASGREVRVGRAGGRSGEVVQEPQEKK